MNEGPVLEKLKELSSFSHHKNKALSCRKLDNALIQPCGWSFEENRLTGGVLDSENNFIDNSGFHEYYHIRAPYDSHEVTARHQVCIYIGCFMPIWGHCFTDSFAKMWFLKTKECASLLKDGAIIVYLTTDNNPPKQFLVDLFQEAGLNILNCEHITKLSRFDSLYIPDNCFYIDKESGNRFFTEEYNTIISDIHTRHAEKKGSFPAKLYFTRTKYKSGKQDYGERKIEAIFRESGYTIVAPEDYTVSQQLDFLAHCDIYASTEGSCSHNAVFCRPEATVIILKKSEYVNGYQLAINDVRMLNVKYVDVGKSIYCDKKEPWQGPFFIYPTAKLKSVLGLKTKEKCLLFNMDWICYIVKYNTFMLIIWKWLRRKILRK